MKRLQQHTNTITLCHWWCWCCFHLLLLSYKTSQIKYSFNSLSLHFLQISSQICELDQRNPEARKKKKHSFDDHLWTLNWLLHQPQLLLAPGSSVFRVLLFVSGRSAGSEGSVCERTQDEEAVLLLPDPLQQFVDSRDGQGLGPQRTEAEVKLEATCHLQERRWNNTRTFKWLLQDVTGSAFTTEFWDVKLTC